MKEERKTPNWIYVVLGIVVLAIIQQFQSRPIKSLIATAKDQYTIYSGPHVRNFDVIGLLSANEEIELTGRHGNSWVTFSNNGNQGWIQVFYLNINGDFKRLPEVNIQNLTQHRAFSQEEQLLSYFQSVISDDRYDPTLLVLHKYINTLEVNIEGDRLTFVLEKDVDSLDDFISLAIDLIFGSAIISNSGRESDWGLSKIEIISKGPEDSYASLYVTGRHNISAITRDSSLIYNLMKSEISYGDYRDSIQENLLDISSEIGCPSGCTYRKEGCDIKGNISIETGEKIYHLPNQKYYSETVINPRFGERWFCTEQEAIANGWRRSNH